MPRIKRVNIEEIEQATRQIEDVMQAMAAGTVGDLTEEQRNGVTRAFSRR